MNELRLIALSLTISVATALPAHAGLLKKNPDTVAGEAAQANMQAVTIWVGASWGLRTQGSANALNRSHEAFAAQGYRVLSVDPYIENGDLQGFFVTYQRPAGAQSQP
ncbi:MAG: hypothetical protein M3Q42_13885 [Pseudomonadota bacterium]|nr:hypothetical protein [Pseudomonadota bacterium]